MNHDEQGPMENLLDGIEEHADALNFDELRAELANRGIDVDAALANANRMIQACDREERLGWMRVADHKKESLRVAETPRSQWSNRSSEEILVAFALFLKGKKGIAFRNKGDLSIEDMTAILEADEQLQRGEQRTTDEQP